MKKFILILLSCMIALTLSACNRQIIDTTFSYDYAIIYLPNGEVVDGEVTSWRDYDGEQIQVTIEKITYLVHSSNIVLINK